MYLMCDDNQYNRNTYHIDKTNKISYG